MIGRELGRLLDPRALRRSETRATYERLVAPGTDDLERVALLVALSTRPRRTDELVGFAREMRRRAIPFPIPPRSGAIDLCGSGGAARPSFNVSTVSAFVVRAAGVPVVKHGNRSRRVCGSSDLLSALGLPFPTSVAYARASFRRFGITFLHAPLFHPATAAVAAARRALPIPTLFNRLGPLTNPARVRQQVAGAATLPNAVETAEALAALGVSRGLAMTSDDSTDEFSPHAPTTLIAWAGGRPRRLRIVPGTLLPREDRAGEWGALSPPAAAEEAERILAGGGGARRGSVLLTSGAALWVSGRSKDLAGGVERAREALDSGAAEAILKDLRALGRRPTFSEAS
jgi:anthranilate phosphoribosyltransferase